MRAAHQGIVADLNLQLEEATAELRASLRAGVDPLQIRRRIKTIETDLDAAIQRAAQADGGERERTNEAAMEQGAQLAVEAAARVAEALQPLNFTEDQSVNHSAVDAQMENIQHATNQLALCRAELTCALAAHAAAEAEVKTLQGRISDIDARRKAITDARLAGKNDPLETNEFVVLGADADELRKMLDEAKRTASALMPSEAIAAVARAEAALQSAEDEAVFTVLTARVRNIETSLLATVRALHDAGKKLGNHHHSVSYTACEELRRLISYGVV